MNPNNTPGAACPCPHCTHPAHHPERVKCHACGAHVVRPLGTHLDGCAAFAALRAAIDGKRRAAGLAS